MAEPPRSDSKPAWTRPLAAIALALIIALGLFVRAHGIARESVWFDEFTSLVHLAPPEDYEASPYFGRWQQCVFHNEAPGLFAFLKQNRSIDPATMPVYDALEYLCNRYVTSSIPGMRLMSVLIGTLMIPLIYLLGRDLFGKGAGLTAAACLALSPIQRHFAQEIHMYALMTLLALLSVYTFVRLVRGGQRRWWVLHIVANVLLVWTQGFGALVPMVEGGFLVLFHFTRYRRNAVWIALHVLIAIPLAAFFTTVEFWPEEETKSWQKVPEREEFLGDLLADDCIGSTYQLRWTTDTWELLVSPERARAMVSAVHTVGLWLKSAFAACAVLLVLRSLRGLVRAWREPPGDRSWQWPFLLVFWWLGPPLILYAASVWWRPIIFPRYTAHCALALYVIIGGAVAALPWRPLRALAVCGFVLAFAYEESLVLHGPQRTDWLSAADHVRAEAEPGDAIFVQDWMWKRVFAYNLGPIANIVSYAKTPAVLAELCAFHLGLDALPGPDPSAWAVIRTDYFASGASPDFEDALTARGLAFELTESGGIQHVLAYRVWLEPGTRPVASSANLHEDAPKEFGDLAMEFWRVEDYDTAAAAARKAIAIDPRYSRAYSYLGMALKEKGDNQAAIGAFEKALDIDPNDYVWSHVNLGMLLAGEGRYDEAVAKHLKALELFPGYSWAYTNLGKAYLGKGDFDEAIDAFEKAVEADPNDSRAAEGLEGALKARESGVVPETAAEASIAQGKAHLANAAYAAAISAFRTALRADPGNGAIHADLGLALLGNGDERGALASFRKSRELMPEETQPLLPLMEAVIDAKDYDGAWAEVERLRASGVDLPKEIIGKLERDSGRVEQDSGSGS